MEGAETMKTETVIRALYAISKTLVGLMGGACALLILGTAGASDLAGAAPVSGMVLRVLIGVAGIGAAIWLSGRIDEDYYD